MYCCCAPPLIPAATPRCHLVQETDYEYFTKFSSEAAAIDYAGDLIGVSKATRRGCLNWPWAHDCVAVGCRWVLPAHVGRTSAAAGTVGCAGLLRCLSTWRAVWPSFLWLQYADLVYSREIGVDMQISECAAQQQLKS